MKSISQAFLILTLSIVGKIYGAEAREPPSPAVKEEIATFRSCEPKMCPAFYVSALGRTFPIPTRYMLAKRSASDVLSLKFISPVPEFSSLKAALAGTEISGIIVIGSSDELKKSEKAGQIGLKYVKTIDGVELFSMFLPPGSRTDGRATESVALVGAGGYVMIGDENKQLPELLLSISHRVVEEREKQVRNHGAGP